MCVTGSRISLVSSVGSRLLVVVFAALIVAAQLVVAFGELEGSESPDLRGGGDVSPGTVFLGVCCDDETTDGICPGMPCDSPVEGVARSGVRVSLPRGEALPAIGTTTYRVAPKRDPAC